MIEPFTRALSGDRSLTPEDLQKAYDAFGFMSSPQLQSETAESVTSPDGSELHVSPLQTLLAAAALSNHGVEPAPRIATSVDTPREGWVVLPAVGTSREAVTAAQADSAAAAFIQAGKNYWSHIGRANGREGPVTWYIAGTPPNWTGTPLAVVVLLEKENERLAQWIGQELLTEAMTP